jgi:hypothetical protein
LPHGATLPEEGVIIDLEAAARSLRTATHVKDALAVLSYIDVKDALADKCQPCTGGPHQIVKQKLKGGHPGDVASKVGWASK